MSGTEVGRRGILAGLLNSSIFWDQGLEAVTSFLDRITHDYRFLGIKFLFVGLSVLAIWSNKTIVFKNGYAQNR